jgi:putative FmdB family regulatory protein
MTLVDSWPVPLEAASRSHAAPPEGWHSYTQSAMPIYEYRCEKGHQFEVMQRMTDDPIVSCERCDRPVQRVFHPVAVHFKGKGFYNTDYGTKRRAREMEKSASDGADKHDAKSKGSKESKESATSSDSSAAPSKKPDSGSSATT